LAITLVHNKTPQENEVQIAFSASRVTAVFVPFDDPEATKQAFSHYEINGLNTPHSVQFFHVVPFQPENQSEPYVAVRPSNMNLLRGNCVEYGRGDEDKVGTHPRFFNWGLKRGTDYGADISLYLDLPENLNIGRLKNELLTLIDENDLTEFIEDSFGKLGTLKLLKEVGQLREDLPLTDAISDLKTRVTGKGLRNG
jgi:hypothetical protein